MVPDRLGMMQGVRWGCATHSTLLVSAPGNHLPPNLTPYMGGPLPRMGGSSMVAAEGGYTQKLLANDYWRWVYGVQPIQIHSLRLSIGSFLPISTSGKRQMEISPRKCCRLGVWADFEV